MTESDFETMEFLRDRVKALTKELEEMRAKYASPPPFKEPSETNKPAFERRMGE